MDVNQIFQINFRTSQQCLTYVWYTHQYIYIYIYTSVIVNVSGNRLGELGSDPERDCVSHWANSLGKNMNPGILPPATSK